MDRGKRSGRGAFLACVFSTALASCLMLCAAPALAVTGAPELVSPKSLTSYKSPLPIEYSLPENAGSGGAALEFSPVGGGASTTVRLTASASTKGTHHFALEPAALTSDTTDVSSASAATLADGKYEVSVVYENEAGEAPAAAFASGVEIKTTTSAPTLLAPVASTSYKSPLPIEYRLPEAAAAGGSWLIFTPTGAGSTVTLTLTASASTAGTHSFHLNPHDLEADTSDIQHATGSSLPDGEYAVAIVYQEALGNQAAEASAEGVRIKTSTPAPTLLLPAPSSMSRSPLKVRYLLQEAALLGSATLELAPVGGGSGTTLTLSGEAGGAGTHTIELSFADPSSSAGISAVQPSGPIAEGEYTVKLSYQEALGNAAESTSVEKVRVKLHTGTPTLTSPASAGEYGSTLAVQYTLPEEASSAGADLMFTPMSGPATSVRLTGAASSQGTHSFTLDLHDFTSDATDVREASPANTLGEGNYTVALSYQDVVENAAAASSAHGVLVAFPKCTAGNYSGTGEPPCVPSPMGYYVPEAGATAALECHAGRYAPNDEMTTCYPASPGYYVPAPGANSELECPAGSYASTSGSRSCTTTPADTYATGGAFEATPCPSGTVSGAGASSCSPAPSSGTTGPTTGGTQPGGNTIGSTPPTSGEAATAKPKVEVIAGKHMPSLARTRSQHYRVSCNVATSVLVRVSVILRVGPAERLEIAARPRTLSCAAGAWTESSASFKLTRMAKRLVSQRGAGVQLRVRVYPAGVAGAGRLVLAAVRGQR